MRAAGVRHADDVAAVRGLDAIDLPTIQRKLNFHYSVTLDLFGAEISTNAANAFNAGIKGRYHETEIDDDHRLLEATYPVLTWDGAQFRAEPKPALGAINARLLDDYVADSEQLVRAWNKVLEANRVDFRLTLPHRAFNRRQGAFASLSVSPTGDVIGRERWDAQRDAWLPTRDDLEYVLSLMRARTRAGEFAPWIAPPKNGVGGKPGDFEYVRIAA